MNEEIKQLIDYLQKFANDDRKEITKYGVEISQDDTKLLLNYVEQLQQENEELKETLKGTTHCYDVEEHQRLNNILTEFEKWLDEEKRKLNTSNDFDRYARLIIIESLDKLWTYG